MESRRQPLSNFINIRIIRRTKIRIKLPKLLIKAMQKRVDHNNNSSKNRSIRAVSIAFTNPFAKYKPVKPSQKSSSRSSEASRNGSRLRPLTSFLAKTQGLKNLMRRETDHTTRVHGVAKQERSGQLARVAPRIILTTCRKWRMERPGIEAMNMRSKQEVSSKVTEEITGNEYELCKKRILMGGKCKPISLSGRLQYDQDGILLSDVLP